MASDKPDDSVRLYSILNRPEGEIAKMGEISVSIKFDPDEDSAFNGWALIQRSQPGRANMQSFELMPIFEETLRAELMEKAKKRAEELDANAILDLSIDEEYEVWTCRGTAVRVLELAKKES